MRVAWTFLVRFEADPEEKEVICMCKKDTKAGFKCVYFSSCLSERELKHDSVSSRCIDKCLCYCMCSCCVHFGEADFCADCSQKMK